jgi:hypothetical protein
MIDLRYFAPREESRHGGGDDPLIVGADGSGQHVERLCLAADHYPSMARVDAADDRLRRHFRRMDEHPLVEELGDGVRVLAVGHGTDYQALAAVHGRLFHLPRWRHTLGDSKGFKQVAFRYPLLDGRWCATVVLSSQHQAGRRRIYRCVHRRSRA